MSYLTIALSVVMLANLLSHALIPLSGTNYKIVFSTLGSLVMIIGIADAIHFITTYQQSPFQLSPRDKLIHTMKLVFQPCLFTSLTTALGFLSLSISQIKPVHEYGILAAFSMLITFIVTMILCTCLLSFVHSGAAARQPSKTNQGSLTEKQPKTILLLSFIAAASKTNYLKILILSFPLILITIFGVSKLELNAHELKYFKEEHPIRVATSFIEEKLGGTLGMEVILRGNDGDFTQPETLEKMALFQEKMEALEQVHNTYSMVEYLKETNWVMQNEQDGSRILPDSARLTAQYLLIGDASVKDFVDYRYSTARISIRLNNLSTKALSHIKDLANEQINTIFGEDKLTVTLSGMVPAYVNIVSYLLTTQVTGFMIAIITILIMMTILTRSIKLALISMVPNLLPVFMGLGLMGWLGIYLDGFTIMIASLGIGLSVDDTIHLLSRFEKYFRRQGCYDQAITQAVSEVGKPIFITTLVLCLGFGSLFFSASFKPIAHFGLIISFIAIMAFIADLLLIPALIKWLKPLGQGINAGESKF